MTLIPAINLNHAIAGARADCRERADKLIVKTNSSQSDAAPPFGDEGRMALGPR